MKLIQALLSEEKYGNKAYEELVRKMKDEGGEAIGYGDNGVVFDLGNVGSLYKVTSDEFELEDAHKAEGKNFKHLANIFDVYTHPSGKAGFYEVEDLVSAPQEVHQALGSGENLYDIGEYIIGGDEKNLANTPKEIQAGGKTFKLHDFFRGVRKELLSAGIDPDNVDLLGGEHNIMMTKSGDLKLIDY